MLGVVVTQDRGLRNNKIPRIPGVVTSATLVRMAYKCCIGQFEDKTIHYWSIKLEIVFTEQRTKPILIKFVSV